MQIGQAGAVRVVTRRHRRWVRSLRALALAASAFLAACGPPGDDGGGDAAASDAAGGGRSVADVASPSGAGGKDTSDARRRGLVLCDDDNPCTSDHHRAEGCVHQPVAGEVKCDDGDPCSTDDFCFNSQCKGYTIVCDDGVNCTLDRCQGGTCVASHNLHWDCLPMVALAAPPRALRSATADGKLLVTGHVGAAKAALAELRINGAKVALSAADSSFAAEIALSPGQTLLRIETVDALGGERLRVQGVRWAPTWAAEGAAVQAGTLQLSAPAVAALAATQRAPTTEASLQAWLTTLLADMAKSTPLQPTLTPLDAGGAGIPGVAVALVATAEITAAPDGKAPATSGASVGLSWQVGAKQPLPAFAAATPLPLGVPLQAGCAAAAKVGDAGGVTGMWSLRVDGWNALLHAAWRGGQLSGDLTSAVRPSCQGLPCVAKLHGEAPWQLDGCTATGPRLRLADLRVDALVPGTDLTQTAYLAIDGDAVLSVAGDVVTLHLGQDVQVWVEVAAIPAPLHATDFQEGVKALALGKLLPMLLQRARVEGVARWRLPAAAWAVGGAGTLTPSVAW